MAYVTDDERVRAIQQRLASGALAERDARAEIAALPPQKDAAFGYLDWEIAEAVKAARVAA